MTQIFPDDSVQGILGEWWVPDDSPTIRRGRLVKAFVPHVDQLPYLLVPIGRTDAREHTLADCEIKPLSVNGPQERARLPVAGLPCYLGEVRAIYRAKKRPMLVLADPGQEVPRPLMAGKPKTLTAPALLGAPYYGVDEGTGTRAGYPPEFVTRVRHCEYNHFFWDMLPIGGVNESLLRVEHLQPVGFHHMSLEAQPWRLTDDALVIMDDWLAWHLTGDIPEDGTLQVAVDLLSSL